RRPHRAVFQRAASNVRAGSFEPTPAARNSAYDQAAKKLSRRVLPMILRGNRELSSRGALVRFVTESFRKHFRPSRQAVGNFKRWQKGCHPQKILLLACRLYSVK